MNPRPVAVTATTEIIRGLPRVRLNEAYTKALACAGLLPLIVPPLSLELVVGVLDAVDGLVLTGGEDVDARHYHATPHSANGPVHAARDAAELALARAARDRGKPTLAICRGIQVVNVAFGGTLLQDIPSEVGATINHDPNARTTRVHTVDLTPDSSIAKVAGTTRLDVNSSHHQSVDRVAAGFRVTGRAPDGVVEAMESTDPQWWMVGVQWHPEELIETPEDWDRRLFEAFATRCCPP